MFRTEAPHYFPSTLYQRLVHHNPRSADENGNSLSEDTNELDVKWMRDDSFSHPSGLTTTRRHSLWMPKWQTDCFLQTWNAKENLRNNNLLVFTGEEQNRPQTMTFSWLFISSLGDRRFNVCLSTPLTLKSSSLSHERGWKETHWGSVLFFFFLDLRF